MSNNEPERFIRPGRPSLAAAGEGRCIDIDASIVAIKTALESLRFGSITLTVHDARVVQLDVTEKTRFPA